MLTHGHIGHIGSAVPLSELTGAQLAGHEADRYFFDETGSSEFRSDRLVWFTDGR